MQTGSTVHPTSYDSGAVLLLAMVFMLMLAVIAGTVMQTAVLQFHMAGNDQFQEEAFQQVQAVASELAGNPDNFLLAGGVGHTTCSTTDQNSDCDTHHLQTPLSAVVREGVELDYRIVRQEPLLLKRFPARESQSVVSGAGNFNVAIFEISVQIDGGKKRLASAQVVQGVAVRLAAPHPK